ncbi:DNA cytosine methyltransferase [Hyphomicrobium sp. MC8b]|uniref:DNA cytosine methyltransferase n=1 Tax=Hyphomicrobium sp. MC8b TaxID=300273 RepID=UPI00391DF2E9
MEKLKLLDLFSGIGGFSLGLEASGYFETVAFCETEPKCHSVLSRHWPGLPIFDDVTTLTRESLRARNVIRVDAICGGFPCQDISTAGSKIGLSGERSGLWREYARLIGELRPDVVFVENVSAMLERGAGAVLGDLASLGYDAEWHCIPASAAGSFQPRDRLWIVAYPHDEGQSVSPFHGGEARRMQALCRLLGDHEWPPFPDNSGMDDGISGRLDRVAMLGNAVVPQIPQMLGRVFGPPALEAFERYGL